MSAPLRVIFAGTPEFSVAPLQALIDSGHDVIAVYTQPDRPAGRGRKLTASPVKQLALQHEIPVFQPESLRDTEAQQQLADLNADIMIVVAYGLILPETVLNTPKYGCLNIHASLLPRWRGAAPIQRAIEAGDAETGVTIMQMDVGLDTGDMLYKVTTAITEDDSAQTLHDRLSTLGSEALMATLNQLQAGLLKPQQQDESQVTYAHKLSKAEAEIDWNQPAEQLVRRIQAFNPWPVAFTQLEGKPLRILQARVSDRTDSDAAGTVLKVEKQGILVATSTIPIWLTEVQPAGKKTMHAYDFGQSRALTGRHFG
ncbi:methionyl-tRNA formyltransferase [Thiomicrorhabdus sp. zzn3]|uniref:methionyl-tRNA formyltransferase n=1 Tax=Thiomicrorhabdus sp. zzn3 TaxID=3039775 RepID=UPI0024370699|nr:methionyl-tRNA formyltransferase [Thiomicrorhabdus sp. zzn3]MDG6778943.1 methionyl-tRNA formyltransferase [Thiomicrorhabdus sp. zzn3]